jgi:hypothetical protein
MAKWSRWIYALTLVAVATTVTLRVLGNEAWHSVLVVTLALLGAHVLGMVRDVARGNLPWTRLLLPSIVWIEAVGLSGEAMWQVRLGTAVVLELAFVVVAIRALRSRPHGTESSEARIARALGALVPPAIAKLAAIEMVIVGSAIRFLVGGWRHPAPAGFTYHRESGLRTMLPILPLLGVGDVLLLELVVLPHATLWVRIVVHAVAAYGLIWLIGLYASFRARPHRLVDARLELHRGILRGLTVDVAQIASIAPLPSFADDWKKRAYTKGAVRLDIAGATVLEMRLHDGTRLLVGVDDPAAFVAAVQFRPL